MDFVALFQPCGLQHLLRSSSHPLHTKRAIRISLALRLRRICSSDDTLNIRSKELMQYLNKRSYNLSFLKREIQRIQTIKRNTALKPSANPTDTPSMSHLWFCGHL